MRKFLLLNILASIIFCFLHASLSDAAIVNVSVIDDQFPLIPVTVTVGDTVLWTNNGSEVHTVTSGSGCGTDGIFNSGDLLPQHSFSHPFTQAGTYPYNCQYHCSCCGMKGTVVVNSPNNIIQVPISGTQSSIQSAYNSAVSGDTIQIEFGPYLQTLDCGKDISVALIGGYDSSFLTDSSDSIIMGSLTVSSGTVTVKNIVIQ
ncbi:MAG: plastocyanin/azurin family copper-binding protein [Dissulfurispiraceae bacterium]